MNRMLLRLFVLSVMVSMGALALVNGCSTTAKHGPEAQLPIDQRTEARLLKQESIFTMPRPPAEAPALSGAYDANDSIAAPQADEELWVIEKESGLGNRATKAIQHRQELMQQAIKGTGSPGTQPDIKTKRGEQIVRGGQESRFREDTDNLNPGTGCLVARLPDKMVPVPLQHTDVKASIAGYIATVDVTQQYANPFAEKIEAVYVFPLPTNAAVNEFLMTIGDRKIRGIIREREEAKQIYENAKRQGYVASLLTQERPNIFTQSIANIEPGKKIDVNIKYFHTLEYVDGSYEFVFPMVVGPRFNPPGTTDGVGAKPQAAPAGSTGQSTEVSYLKPNERSGHDISLALDIDAGVKVESIKSINHKVKLDRSGETLAKVTLDQEDSIPNKDFVLRYQVAGKTVKSGLMAQKNEKGDGGYFTLMLFPPESLQDLPRKPLELVFTLDVSGSMSGKPIAQAKDAVTYALKHMRADDTFNVIRFANSAEQMAPRAVPAEKENVDAALKYIETMDAGGGTMMIEGIRKSLQVTPDPDHLRFVAFLTDGYIGNEREILGEIHKLRGPSRIFSFGVGSSVNRYLLDGMARLGQGCAAYLSLNEDGGKVMADYFERISHPALTDLSIDFGGMQVSDVYPSKLPDLFVGRPVIITGRYSGKADASVVKVRGKVGGEMREMAMKIDASDAGLQHRGITPVWARAKISELGDRATYEDADLAGPSGVTAQIRETALEYGLMSAYTAFVAVDSSTRTAGDHGTSVAVPVPVPDGVRYETTVPE